MNAIGNSGDGERTCGPSLPCAARFGEGFKTFDRPANAGDGAFRGVRVIVGDEIVDGSQVCESQGREDDVQLAGRSTPNSAQTLSAGMSAASLACFTASARPLFTAKM